MVAIGLKANYGDMIQVSFNYANNGESSNPRFILSNSGNSDVAPYISLRDSGTITRVLQINRTSFINEELYYMTLGLALTNVSIVNLSLAATPKGLEYEQYKSIPSNDTERLNVINNNITQNICYDDGSN